MKEFACTSCNGKGFVYVKLYGNCPICNRVQTRFTNMDADLHKCEFGRVVIGNRKETCLYCRGSGKLYN